jgi:hypothetical protein
MRFDSSSIHDAVWHCSTNPNKEITMTIHICDGCEGELTPDLADDETVDGTRPKFYRTYNNALAIKFSWGGYAEFVDSCYPTEPLEDDYDNVVILCHDCVVKFLNMIKRLPKHLSKEPIHHPYDRGSTPCCPWGWTMPTDSSK